MLIRLSINCHWFLPVRERTEAGSRKDKLILPVLLTGQRESYASCLQIGGFEQLEPNRVPVETRWP
jgi:hypothetical protein